MPDLPAGQIITLQRRRITSWEGWRRHAEIAIAT
jgi:hypothetical protein